MKVGILQNVCKSCVTTATIYGPECAWGREGWGWKSTKIQSIILPHKTMPRCSGTTATSVLTGRGDLIFMLTELFSCRQLDSKELAYLANASTG